MGLFSKKPRKTPEELKKEREEKIASTSSALKLQIISLERKREVILKKVLEAKQKGLRDQEAQARGLLKQTMASIRREQGMLMTLELAVESRDLAQLNMNFLDSIATLSDDIIGSSEHVSDARVKKIGDRYTRAVFESGQQKERIDNMLAMGEFATAVGTDTDKYPEFDAEIDSMLEDAELNGMTTSTNTTTNRMRF